MMHLVTGATGFLGSHLLYHLLQKGEHIRAIHRAGSSFKLLDRVFGFYNSSKESFAGQVEWVETDLNDIYALQKCFEGIETVYHVAGKVSFLPADRAALQDVNVKGTANMVNMALLFPITKFCYVSSIAALGRADYSNVIDENVVWKSSKRNSNYAVSKYGGEREVWRGIEEGLNAIIVNPGIILGPGEISSGSTRLVQTVDNGLKFYTSGTNGFIDVRDVAEIMMRLMESNISGERFILVAENMDSKTLFEIIAKNLNKPAPAYKAVPWMGNLAWRWYALRSFFTGIKPLVTRETATTATYNYEYSADKIRQILNYNFIPVNQTIAELCSYHLKQIKES